MFHHVAIAVKDVRRSHAFYTDAMGFRLVKIVKRQTPRAAGPSTSSTTPATVNCSRSGTCVASRARSSRTTDWRGGMSTGAGLPYWVNHLAFDCKDIGGLEGAKQRWLDKGYHVSEVKHEFIHSIYTRDPDGTLVEFTYDTPSRSARTRRRGAGAAGRRHARDEPEYEGVVHKSPNKKKREALEVDKSAAAI